ncbi:MAG: cyclic nucleotide-binding domain-containing protein [Polyangiaceae bacterium]
MTEPAKADLFAFGKRCFDAFVRDLREHGIDVDPALALRRGDGVMSHYSPPDRKIYLSVPDPSTPVGKLQTMVLTSVLACRDEAELLSLFELFVPRIIAHEIAHHLRHVRGRFGDSPWEEEQVANRFATALTMRRLPPSTRARARELVARILTSLAGKIDVADAATMSYHDVLYALNASGKIGDTTVERAAVAQRLLDAETQRMLAESGDLPTALGRGLDLRSALIAEINAEYATDFLKYVYYHAGWLRVDLGSHDVEYIDSLAREHLGLSPLLLPHLPAEEAPTEPAVRACFRAFLDARVADESAGRYFYKRYRSLLWSLLRTGGLLRPSDAEILRRESAFFLESWDEGASDALKYVAHLATESVRRLFPARLRAEAASLPDALSQLPTETDRRLYRRAVERTEDPAAENTLSRLSLLERTDVLHHVPAESLLALAHVLARLRLVAGETLFWEGDEDADVFILADGELESVQRAATVSHFRRGSVLGETTFFSRRPRHTTVRARKDSELFVIKHVDLLSFAYRHPSILLQMGGAFARRLEDQDTSGAEEAVTLRFGSRPPGPE